MLNRSYIGFFLLLVLFCSCKKNQTNSQNAASAKVSLSYAKGFSIAHSKNYTIITVYNPWENGSIYDKYYLTKDPNVQTPSDGHKILIPLTKVMVNSTTHIGFISALNEINSIIGACNVNYIYSPTVLSKLKSGRIKNMGPDYNIDIERLLTLHPQAVFATAYDAKDDNNKRMRNSGLSIIYNIEWQEKSLLGRAEWIKFMGAFFDKEKLADSLFCNVVKEYNRVKAIARKAKTYPSVMSGEDFRGTWSLPGGESYTGQLFKDAHTSYLYSKETSRTSIPSNVEEVLVKFHDSDIWIGTDVHSSHELSMANPRYKLFKAFRNKQVYNANLRCTAAGGNDYWESGVVRPDLLLSDMVKIAHPELLPNYKLTYMERLR
jgi:iron complex transport system substrate-binding protein